MKDREILRRLAEQQREAPFARDVLKLLDELEEARSTATRLEARIAELHSDQARPGYARITADDTAEDIERKMAIAFAPAEAAVASLKAMARGTMRSDDPALEIE